MIFLLVIFITVLELCLTIILKFPSRHLHILVLENYFTCLSILVFLWETLKLINTVIYFTKLLLLRLSIMSYISNLLYFFHFFLSFFSHVEYCIFLRFHIVDLNILFKVFSLFLSAFAATIFPVILN